MTSLEQIAHYAEVPIDVSVELDRRILTIRQILDLETGSVVKLGRSAGENIDILVGGALMAFGEIVIIEDTMGVRITDFNQEE
ncbi:MAG: FliM/FliN family flagellar motor switch protein [Acidobacteria bacterium]|nr:FliM/FliN family flagellar motor switch protein [Acidobacteriota bacterium]